MGIGKFASGLRWETVAVVASSASAAVYCTRLCVLFGWRSVWRDLGRVPRPGGRAVRRAVCWVLLRYGLTRGYHDGNDHQGR